MTQSRTRDLPKRFVGLDFETTGLDLAGGNVPIEVGAAYRDDSGNIQWFELPIWHAPGSFTWQPEAFEVNGYSLEQISDERVASPWDIVDARLAVWLDGAAHNHRIIPVGWNVGSFDWPFAKKWLPLTAALFTDNRGNPAHQFADLNSMLFLLESPDLTKSSIHRRVEDAAGHDGLDVRWHSGGFDAYGSVIALEIMQEWVELR